MIFIYIESNVLLFTFRVEYVERRSQSNYIEYDWLVTDLTQNTRGRYILIFLVVLITPTKYGISILELGINQ